MYVICTAEPTLTAPANELLNRCLALIYWRIALQDTWPCVSKNIFKITQRNRFRNRFMRARCVSLMSRSRSVEDRSMGLQTFAYL